jgi:membrane-bound serine protease (ClpP class)
LVGRLAASSFGRKVVSGREEMIGLTGYVLDWSGSRGHVLVHSERWRATAGSNLNPGQTILVTALDDLTLTVEPSSTQTSAT